MLPPCNKPASEIAREEGIGECVPYNWREAVRAEGRLMPEAMPALRELLIRFGASRFNQRFLSNEGRDAIHKRW